MPLTSRDTGAFRQAAIAEALRGCRLFTDLDPTALAEVVDACALKSLSKGEYLFREGDPSEGFYVLRRGSINIHRISSEGKEQVICIFHPPESFAEVGLATVDTYPANAIALESSQVVLVRKHDFRELIRRRPELALRMLGSMSFHLKHLVQLIEDLKFKQIEARFASWLLRQAGSPSGATPAVVHLEMSKKTLAAQLGVASETLSRTLAKFRDEGLILVEGKAITLLNPAGIMRYQSHEV
ncbi:MAG: Crp/Fnr family transcriptional regulator [Puniceicoccaceae bacterium]|nr:MAG: Crp/Fnr family transcriptional regulator [Puniceicoccaceae bacterium]